jgi:hypothetical protein
MLRSFFITFLIAILFGKENTQNMFVVFFAKGVADKEENQRSADADNYLVQIKEFDLQRHSSAVGEYAARAKTAPVRLAFFQNSPKIRTQKNAVSRPPKANIFIFQITLGGAMAIK